MDIKKITKIGIGVATIGFGAYKLFSGREPEKYSKKWFETVSDEELNNERENVRQQYCSAGDNFSSAINLQNLLRRFDSVLSERAWGDETPRSPSYPREHGHNLYKND